jgi:PAS domain S-box-containing protein
MLLAFPTILQEIGLYIAFGASILGFLGLIERWGKPFSKWFQKNITKDVNDQMENICQRLDKVSQDFTDHTTYVRHHLGPNGTTPPVYVRLQNLEKNMSIYAVRQRKFMNALDTPIAEADKDGGLIMVNRAWLESFGVKEWEVMGLSWKRFIKDEDFDIFMERLRYSSVTAEAIGPFQILAKDSNDVIKTLDVRINPLKTEESEVVGFLIELGF